MSEGVFNIVALGRQANVATAVAASTVFPVDAGFLGFELDRATESPDEDHGSTSREHPGRTSHGVRWATASLPFVGRFEDIVHALEMHVDTIGAPSGTASPYTYGYLYDESGNVLSDALKTYTVEYGVDGSTQDEWRAYGVIADTLEFGFDALSAPGNSMWRGTLGLVGINREPNALTGTAVAPPTLETMEGHLTTLATGSTSTNFGSLAALTGSLKQFSLSSALSAKGLVYGGTSDAASAIGRSDKGTVSFTALVGISSASKTALIDVYEAAGSVAQEQRWRLDCDGSGVNDFKVDARVSFRAINVGSHEGERLYEVNGVWVYDATLLGRGKFTVTNAVATIP